MSGIVGSSHNIRGSGVVAKLGTDGQVFTSAGAGVSQTFEAAAGGGKLLQVVSTIKTDTTSTTSTSYADVTGMTLSITPASSSNKILILVSAYFTTQSAYNLCVQLMRDTTALCVGDTASSRTRGSTGIHPNSDYDVHASTINFLDSPSTTSGTTYKLQWAQIDSTTAYLNRTYGDGDTAHRLRSASTITAMEIGA